MVTPYITFSGDCREALALYEAVFGAAAEGIRCYGDYVPEGVLNPPGNLSEWVMHAEMDICGTRFWFADEIAAPVTKGNNVKLTTTAPTAAAAQAMFAALSEGAHITLPPTETFYSAFHGALTDRFGVCWNIVAMESAPK